EALSLDAQLAVVYNNRGNAFGKRSQHQKAIADFSRAIHIDPLLAVAYGNRGDAYSELGEYTRAIEDINEAIASVNRAEALRNVIVF
ncbi:MAG: tetratricopeptide repeat protein, partial [Proteobacteria bacterium]|nr:tetratricopeptide repeat protein [Pseudomonadota bacterium]